MIIGACRVRLHLPGCHSLKEKRGRLKPLLARLPREFNVAVAETDLQDVWQSAEIGLVTVAGGDTGGVHARLEAMLRWLEANSPDAEIVDVVVELR